MFIKTGDSDTKKRSKVEEVTGESLAVLCFGSLEN